jgi:murein endopeptidase
VATDFEDDDPPISLPSRVSGPIVVPLDDPPLESDCDRLAVRPEPPKTHLTRRRYQPVTEGGNPNINTPLPREGTGFRAYKTVETEYGYPGTVEFVKTLGKAWAELYPDGPILQIGDLAVQGGGLTPKSWGHPNLGYHLSHGSGLDFDVQIIAKGNVPQKPRSVTTDKTPALYDRERTQQLVDLIQQLAQKRFDLILSADTKLVGITPEKNHNHHLHVRLKP